ncbi:MAG: hypothetical protein ACRDC3_08615 [Paraclostridium dentum]|uniref:hypothetical protein n=1 Tax=Paraclostridium dentum TaxID=2662455 RepID=UPI003EE4A0B8
MVLFEKNKIYKHKKTGAIRKVDYIYDDPKNSSSCVVFKGNESNYISNICNEYEYSTQNELESYIKNRNEYIENINDDKKVEMNKNGLKIFNNNGKLIFSFR